MATGLKVTCQDGSGSFQIDENYRNLFLRAKGTLTTNQTDNTVYNTSSIRNVLTSGFKGVPLVAINRNSASSLAKAWTVPTGNAGEYYLNVVVNAAIGASVDYYIFDVIDSGEASNYGLKVWNAAGQLQFDAAKKPMRVVAYLTGAEAGSVTLPTGRTYAVALAGGGGSNSISGGYILLTGGSRVDASSGVAAVGMFQIQGGSGGSVNSRMTFYALVLDVTNY